LSTTLPQFWRRFQVKSELVTPSHLARKAVVYIRQSTPHQVVSNQESLRLQYGLHQRARELGWHEADIDVIDADLGLSGASAAQRSGFKELVGRVGISEVGLILSIDVTRLARNCSDWYPLLDICGLRGCLIADRDGVYDPGSANGRLLLGLKGTISELELHTIRSRLTAGLLAKAARGELALNLPIGLVRDPSGVVVKEPDMAVQERLDLVFAMFLKFRTVAAVMRVLNKRGLDLPRRDRHGDLRWARATVSALAAILKNPAYAGAFVYGRTRTRVITREGASPAKAPRPMEEWRIVVKDRYPPYIDWLTYEKIRAVITDNRAEYMRIKTRGSPRDGDLLLHGIAWCARCGHKMFVRYKGGGQYVCNHLRSHSGLPACQHIPAARIDEAVANAFLTAVVPAELDALSSARRAQQQMDTALRTSAEHQVERKRYAAALAERQFNRVDPDNRLVAAELERRWESALSEVRAAEEALAQHALPKSIAQMAISKGLSDKVISLAGRLPQLWADDARTDAQRKALLRCLVDKVVLDRGEHDITLARIVWRGGAVTDLHVKMRVNSVARLTRGAEMRKRVIDLVHKGTSDDEIATVLTSEGHRSPNCDSKVLLITVQQIRRNAGISGNAARRRWSHDISLISPPELAARLNIPVNWLYVQIRQKRILIDKQPTGAYLFQDTPAVTDAIRNLRDHVISQLDLRICQSYQKGYQHG
jgi:DNA invertase Pin-like site-specific DNA recombinase